jgi:uncharacterized protein YebE (UPF0316 family)
MPTFAFEYVIIPLLICLARIIDVSIGTIRIIFVSKGMKIIAPVLGFFEIIVWLVAISQIMQNLTNVINYIAYGLGFALGTYVGIYLEEKISIGYVLLRVITRREAMEFKEYLQNSGHRYTTVDAESDEGSVVIVYMPLRRKVVYNVIENIKKYNPRAFYTLEDVRRISGDTKMVPSAEIPIPRRYRLIPRTKKK